MVGVAIEKWRSTQEIPKSDQGFDKNLSKPANYL